MKITLKTVDLNLTTADTIIIGIHEDGKLSASALKINKLSKGQLKSALDQFPFEGKVGQVLPLPLRFDHKEKLIILVGCGPEKKISNANYRKLLFLTAKYLAYCKIKRAANLLAELEVAGTTTEWKIKQITEATYEGFYRFDYFKSKKSPIPTLQELIIAIPSASSMSTCKLALAQGLAVAAAVSKTKDLANTPSNICTPAFLAAHAKELAKEFSDLKVTILEEAQMAKLGMGALLAVSQGSAQEAKLICLEYRGGDKKTAPIALIGKGITFDTGGNSLKSPDSMVGMKYDMCGAATVLGTIQAAAQLKLPINVVGIIAAVENMPGGTAYKPEDILTSLSGQTIEVISTDAEGRLVLADAITYCARYAPCEVIDIATLTGAAVIALGFHTSALLSNDDDFAAELLTAGIESNDRAWQLPLFPIYQEQINSPFADMANTGGRSAGTITAACFLARFAEQFKWAHLDVAGTAAMMAGGSDRYATGRPVPLLVQHLINRSRQ